MDMILYYAILIGLVILIFIGGRKFVFSKVRINKWIPLVVAVVLFAVQLFLKPTNGIVSMGLQLVILTAFMWFMDIQTTGGPKAPEKKIVIKPKAKPNRVKHLNKDGNK